MAHARESIPPVKPVHLPLQGDSTTSRRWAVWQLQMHEGHRSCFGTPERFFCTENDCPFSDECRRLRANWRH